MGWEWQSFMTATQPHDIYGALVIAGIALLLLAGYKLGAWGLVFILVIAVGVAVDLTAHGWQH